MRQNNDGGSFGTAKEKMAAAVTASHLLHRPPLKPSLSPPSSVFSCFLKTPLVISNSNSIVNPVYQFAPCSFRTTTSSDSSSTTLFTSLPRFPSRSFLSSHSLSNASHPQSFSVSLEKEEEEEEEEARPLQLEIDDSEEAEDGEDEVGIEAESEKSDSGGNDSQMGLESLRPNGDGVVKLPNLTVKEKKELASYAHSLGKKLKCQLVGKSGVTANVATSFVETLEANELLKVLYFVHFTILSFLMILIGFLFGFRAICFLYGLLIKWTI